MDKLIHTIKVYDDHTEYLNDQLKLHRTDGPAYTTKDGYNAWWLNGERHRPDKPATIYPDGSVEYFYFGKRHNDNGPAVINAVGTEQYWLHGVKYSYAEYCVKTDACCQKQTMDDFKFCPHCGKEL